MEFTIIIEPEVIDALGVDDINTYLNDAATRLQLKAAAREALADLDYFDALVNDPQWQTARSQAWKQDENRYVAH